MILVFCMILGILAFPNVSIESGKTAVELCFTRVLPSLFPFFVLQDMAIKLGLPYYLSKHCGKLFYFLFKINDPTPFFLGIIGGYPLGAKTIDGLYQERKITKQTAQRLLYFCNNAGPAFIVGFVGVLIFENILIGYLLLFTHIFTSIFIGIVLGHTKKNIQSFQPLQKPNPEPLFKIFISSVNVSFSNILSVCGFIIFFHVLVSLLLHTNVFSTLSSLCITLVPPLKNMDVIALLSGCLEMTTGLQFLSTTTASSMYEKLFIASFLLGFGGLSIHCQTLNFCGYLKTKAYTCTKFIHGIISGILSIFFYKILNFSQTVAHIPQNYAVNYFSILTIVFIGIFTIIILYLSAYKHLK